VNIKDLLNLMSHRYSCRAYDKRDVPDELIQNCLEAARLAPSACNKQPWRFAIVKKPELREKIYLKCLLPGISMDWLRDAPVFAILCAEKNFLTHKAAPFISGIPYHYIDCGIAGEHFVLAATAQGLGTCWIGWFKEKALKKLLNIPSTITVISIISLGFPSTTDSNVRRTERKSIKEILLNIS